MLRTSFFRAGTTAGACAAVLLHASTSLSYCRTHTCDPKNEECTTDENECIVEGKELFWPRGRVTMFVDSQGSPDHRISGDQSEQVLMRAFDSWASADCDSGEPPALNATVEGQVSGVETGYDEREGAQNQNLLIFRDDLWDFDPSAVAVTTMTFDVRSGEVVDSDMELNTFDHELAIDAGPAEVDLLAVVTHEAGHVFGLAHSIVEGATMQPEAQGYGFRQLRTLSADDQAGICAIYPNDPDGCGCRTVGGRSPGTGSAAAAAFLAVACVLRARGRASRLALTQRSR